MEIRIAFKKFAICGKGYRHTRVYMQALVLTTLGNLSKTRVPTFRKGFAWKRKTHFKFSSVRPWGRNHIPLSALKHRSDQDSASRHLHRRLTPAEVLVIEERIAAQSREIQTLLHDNQRLAATHVALKQDVATAQQELPRLSATASSFKAERDAQVREVYERSLKLEAEARSFDGLSAELNRIRAETKEIRDKRKEFLEKLKNLEGEISSIQPQLQEFSDLKAEIEVWQREIRRGRAAVEYERKMHSDNLEISEAMEKHMVFMARETEKLGTELANAEQRARAAVVGAVSAANQGPGYAIHQLGYAIQQPRYGGIFLSDPHVAQPGYAGNSFSDPHLQQPHVYGGNFLSDAHLQQPGYSGNLLSDPLVQQPGYSGNLLSDPLVQQPGYGGNSLSDPFVHQEKIKDPLESGKLHTELAIAKQSALTAVLGPVSAATQGPGYANQQPGYSGNSLSDSHVVEPTYGENSTPDPHVVHQD